MADRITRIRYGDGVGDVIDFADPASGYKIVTDGYRPTVARRKRGLLGGERFTRVDDTMLLMVSGDDAEEAGDRVDLLNAVIDQAEQWRGGAAVHVVTIEYRVEGSVLANPLQAAITGQPSGGEVVQLPFNYDSATSETVIGSADDPLVFGFERRGLWLEDEESEVSSSAAENPAVHAATFTGPLTAPSPVKVTIRFTGGNGDNDEDGDGYLFVADDAQKIYVSNTVAGSTSGTSTINLAHADADASGNQVLQIVPNDTVPVTVGGSVSHTFLSGTGPHTYMFFMVVQNLSNSVTWSIETLSFVTTPGISYSRSRAINSVLITPDNNNPQVVIFGPFTFDQAFSQDPNFVMTPSAGPGAGHELEIDTVAVVELDAGVRVLSLRGINFSDFDNHVTLDHNLLSQPKPSVIAGVVSGTSLDHSIDHEGVPVVFNNTSEIAAAVLGVQQNNWILGHDAGGGFSPVQTAVYATRRPAYLVPR